MLARAILPIVVVAVGLGPATAAAPARDVDGLRSCGVVSAASNIYPSGSYRVGATVSCARARGSIRTFLRGGGRQHVGQTFSDSYTAIGPWRCGYHTASAGCTTRSGERIVGRHQPSPARSSAPPRRLAGVEIGAPYTRVERALGLPTRLREIIVEGGVSMCCAFRFADGTEIELLLEGSGRAEAITVTSPDVRTGIGLTVGDPLRRAKRLFPAADRFSGRRWVLKHVHPPPPP